MQDKIILSALQREKINNHTLECYPNEMCGLLTSTDFIPLNNIHKVPQNAFKIDKLEIIKYIDEIVAIVHSHTRPISQHEIYDLRTPSTKDIEQQQLTNIPWIIVGSEGVTVTEPIQFPRIRNNTYVGRPFMWFINDCYNLLQDWYWFELGIDLPDHTTKLDYFDISKLSDVFDEYYEQYKFEEVPFRRIQNNDVVILSNSNFNRNHLGIYFDGKILHQNQVSIIEPIESFIGRIHKVLRYVG